MLILLAVCIYAACAYAQYMQHGSLRQVLNRHVQWAQYLPAARAQILRDAAAGMAFLHANDLFHRDLKRCATVLHICWSMQVLQLDSIANRRKQMSQHCSALTCVTSNQARLSTCLPCALASAERFTRDFSLSLHVCVWPCCDVTSHSHNVLITDDDRAVLTDFGLCKTASTVSGMGTTKSLFQGGTLCWTGQYGDPNTS